MFSTDSLIEDFCKKYTGHIFTVSSMPGEQGDYIISQDLFEKLKKVKGYHLDVSEGMQVVLRLEGKLQTVLRTVVRIRLGDR